MATVEELEAKIESLSGEIAGAKTRITELNGEAKGHRLNAANARKEVETLEAQITSMSADHDTATKATKAEIEAAKAETKAAQTAAAEAATTAKTGADQRVISSELRVQAAKAGMVDLDALKLLDTSKVTISNDGIVAIPETFFTEAKTAKPYLFGSATTSSQAKTPPDTTNAPKNARDMSDDEFKVAMTNKSWLAS